MMKRFWRDMATTDFDETMEQAIAILPVAAIEQHGPHLPVGVDSFIAEGLVERAASALPAQSRAIFLPVQQICKSNEHVRFPGTLTLPWDITIASWLAIGEGLVRCGIQKVVIITSHGGNVSPAEIVTREWREKHNMLAVSTSWEKLGNKNELYNGAQAAIDIHAGQRETSIMLALRPDLVDIKKAQDFTSAQDDLKNANQHLGFHSSNANISWLAQDLNPQGPVGNAANASAQKGEDEIASMVDGFCTMIHELEQLNVADILKL